MLSEDLMSFFLDLSNHTLSYLYLGPDSVSSLTWTQVLNSSQPYLYDFEIPLAFTNTACRVVISGVAFPFPLPCLPL